MIARNGREGVVGRRWRRGRDSNPRWVAPYRISSAAPSATRRPLRGTGWAVRGLPCIVRVGAMAERVGFEPTVLSHTAFRERHHQPLGHLSAAEDSKADNDGGFP